jgi:hypothetical protein
VNRLVTGAVGNFFAPDDEELLIGTVEGVEALDSGEIVVISE